MNENLVNLKGRVCEIQKNTFYLMHEDNIIPAKLKGSFYNDKLEIPVVGDYVDFDFNPQGDSIIKKLHPRKSELKRPDFLGHAQRYAKNIFEQVMVANFDYVFIVASLNDNYNFNRIARYVAITLQGNGIPVVILTKSDLCSNPGRYIREVEDLSDKVRVHAISAKYGIGLNELEQYFVKDTTIAILGSSGVGKSTLVNSIVGSEVMKTSEIREEDSKGRHTTTYRSIIPLKNGVMLIDTPGMRELGMCDVSEGIEDTFEDVTNLFCQCRFSDCKHDTEPGCAIKRAIADGTLQKERYELYKSLHAESDKTGFMKAISIQRKKINSNNMKGNF